MQFDQIIKTWAVVLTLPILSVGIAATAVSLQHYDQPLAAFQPNAPVTPTSTESAPAGQISKPKAQLVSWRKLRNQEGEALQEADPFGNAIDTQDDSLPPVNPDSPADLLQENSSTEEPQDLNDMDVVPQEPIRQVRKIQSEYAGWQQATRDVSKNRIGDTLRANWIALQRNGTLVGRVSEHSETTPIPGQQTAPTTVFIIQQGRLIAQTEIRINGDFRIDGLTPGSYTIFVYGPSSMAAFGFVALPYQGEHTNHPTELNILAASRGGFLLNNIVKRSSPLVRFPYYQLYEIGEEASDPPALYGLEGLANHDPTAVPATTIQHRQIKLSNGTMVGRLHRFDDLTGRPISVRDARVQLIQGKTVVAETDIDRYGVFEISDLAPGYYSLVAAGADGF